MSTSKIQRTPSRSLERVVQGMYVRSDEKLAKRLAAKGKHKEATAAEERVRRRRELIEAQQ